jgi:hypothetical protein
VKLLRSSTTDLSMGHSTSPRTSVQSSNQLPEPYGEMRALQAPNNSKVTFISSGFFDIPCSNCPVKSSADARVKHQSSVRNRRILSRSLQFLSQPSVSSLELPNTFFEANQPSSWKPLSSYLRPCRFKSPYSYFRKPNMPHDFCISFVISEFGRQRVRHSRNFCQTMHHSAKG